MPRTLNSTSTTSQSRLTKPLKTESHLKMERYGTMKNAFAPLGIIAIAMSLGMFATTSMSGCNNDATSSEDNSKQTPEAPPIAKIKLDVDPALVTKVAVKESAGSDNLAAVDKKANAKIVSGDWNQWGGTS